MTKLEHLIETARRQPEKLSPDTLARVNAYLAKTGKQTINRPTPTPWGRSLTLGEIAAKATGTALPPPLTARVDVATFQRQQLERARELERKRNMDAPKSGGIVAGCFAM